MSVVERGTQLEEGLDIVLYPDRSYYEAHIRITNPTQEVVTYGHCVNPMWAPGGHNELTDNTEFIIPTDRMLIPGNFGPSPQEWATSEFRFIKGWDKGPGFLMADGLNEGFYSAYSHDEEEGVVRVFDKEKTPGGGVWTYGYYPTSIPMGSGAPNKGYAEIWGSTSKSKYDPEERLVPGEVVEWTEWMYPYQDTGGLSYANEDVALNFVKHLESGTATLALCPSARFDGVQCTVVSGDVLLFEDTLDLAPDQPFRRTMTDPTQHEGVKVTLLCTGGILAEYMVPGVLTGVEERGNGWVASRFSLDQNYPNPFNPLTAIAYNLPQACDVTLNIYALTGQRVATLVSDYQAPSYYKVIWDAGDFANGIYFYRLEAGEFVETKRMALIK
jgi:hypothetical protein